MKKKFVVMILWLLFIVICFSVSAFADSLNNDLRAQDIAIFDQIDSNNPKSEYQIRFRNNSNLSSDGGGACNVSAITTLLNRRLVADYQSGSFTVSNVLTSLGCTNIYTDGKLYSDKNFGTGGKKLFQYYYWKGSSSNWCVSGKKYNNGNNSYTITQIGASTIKNNTSKANFNAYIANLLHNHPEGIAIRNKSANHVGVIYRYSYQNGSYKLYIKDPVGNYSGEMNNNAWLYKQCGGDLYTNIDFIVYINGTCKMVNQPAPQYDAFEFQNVLYPRIFRIDTTNGWDLAGGTLVCDQKLKTITTEIKTADGKTTISGPRSYNISGYSYTIRNLDTRDGTNNGVRFSFIKNAGDYVWILTATDETGRELMLEMPFTAVSSGNKDEVTASKTYSSEGSVVATIDGVYKFNKNDESRSGPAEAYDKVTDYGKDAIVFVVGEVVNQYNNTWYLLADGSYVWAGDVDNVPLSVTSLSGSYEYTKAGKSKVWPYAASSTVTSYNKGDTVTVTGKVTNSYGNVWYKISDGSYIYSGEVALANSVPTLRFMNVDYPAVYVMSANGWYLGNGVIESDCTLTSVKSEIKKGTTVVSSKTLTNIGKTRLGISYFDTISDDNGVRFSYIKNKGYGPGQYSWNITATDAKGRSLTLYMPFEAVQSGEETVLHKSLSYGENLSVTGITIEDAEGNDYTDSSMIQYGYDETSNNLLLIARVTPEEVTDTRVAWASSDENVLKLVGTEDIEGGTIAVFSRTGMGSAIITAAAQDGSGKTATVDYQYRISSIGFDAVLQSVQVNQTVLFQPNLRPSIASSADLIWSSSDPSVATVDEYGVVRGVSIGNARITIAPKNNSNLSAYCDVTVSSNITNVWMYMSDSLNPTLGDVDLDDVHPVMIGDVFTLTAIVDFNTYTSEHDCVFNIPEDCGLSIADDEQAVSGSFVAERAGLWTVNVDVYENGHFVDRYPVSISVDGGPCGDNATWSYDEGVLTISGTGAMYDYADTDFEDYDNIPGWTAYREEISTVIIERGITSVGNFSFVAMPDLDDLTLPEGLMTIGHGAFAGCTGLENVYIPEGTMTIGSEAFARCYSLTRIGIPDSVNAIYADAFKDCEYVHITCHDGTVAHIYAIENEHQYTLRPYSIKDFDFQMPASLTTIEEEAFSGIVARRVRLGENVTSIGSKAFAYCPNLVSIYIPDGCTSIPKNAFDGVAHLTIYGHDGSYAEFYANKYGYDFVWTLTEDDE